MNLKKQLLLIVMKQFENAKLFIRNDSILNSGQITYFLKYVVYPTCAINPQDMRMYHKLEDDLGYVGDSKRLLVTKTNNVFGIENPNKVKWIDINKIETVDQHHTLVVKKLKAANRLSL